MVPVEILFEKKSLGELHKYIISQSENNKSSDIIYPIKSSGSKNPLICVHSGTGDAVTYRYIGRYMDKDRPVMALRFNMKKVGLQHPLTFLSLAKAYCKEIKRIYPDGPYYICGHCWGGVLAFLIASELEDSGADVGMLAMFDSVSKIVKAGKSGNSMKFMRRIAKIFKNSILELEEVSFKQKIRLIIKKTGSVFNLFGLYQSNKIYSYGAKTGNRLIMKISGKAGALGYASKKYLPEPYNGKIHYFVSMKGIPRDIRHADYWENMAKEFEIIELNSHHNTMIVGENARILSGRLSEIMENADA